MKGEPAPESTRRSELKKLRIFFGLAILIIFVFAIALGPITGKPSHVQPVSLQNSHLIGLILSDYAKDHDGHYPEGKTSTEIFQKLLDEQYVSDPIMFYLPLAGKVRPQSNQMKAENIGWDMTCCVDSSSPVNLPVVFMTGYKVTYFAGAEAVPVDQPPRDWTAICYKDNTARIILSDRNGSIPNFIPADFDPKGKVYRQLTP